MGNRIKGLKGEWEKQVAEREALNGRLTAIQIDQGVIMAATKRGLRPSAWREPLPGTTEVTL